ncbi:MAG: hypothetical protein MUF02_02495 [Acidobacteria bacterium]|nr:hypothetical protein [Acidobacteriota bacterium]
MNTKKIFVVLLILLVCSSLALSAAPKKGKKYAQLQFKKGELYLTPQIGLNSWAVPFGANVEYAVTENIGIGGTVMAWFWSGASVILPSVDAAYHLTKLGVDKLDLFGGVGVGFAIYNAGGGIAGSSGIYISPFVAGRYWFSEKMAVSLRVNIGIIGDWTGVGGLFGVTFRI